MWTGGYSLIEANFISTVIASLRESVKPLEDDFLRPAVTSLINLQHLQNDQF